MSRHFAEDALMRSVSLAVLSALLLTAVGCASSNRAAVASSRARGDGLASYYAPRFEGRPTASGEIFHTSALTAAHRTLPFGTRVRVTNLNNDKSVTVK